MPLPTEKREHHPESAWKRNTRRPMTHMPRPGDLAPGFTIEPGRCWRLVFKDTVQGSHCRSIVRFRGRHCR
jgi:hypothetical protein